MTMTALEIYKYLPKKNCNKCGVPTCLAFAMQLASLKSTIDKCPYLTQESKSILSASATPPIKLVKIGAGEHEIQIGDETVMFRHEKTFVHPAALGAMVSDGMTDDEIAKKLAEANRISWERIGQKLKLDLIAVKSDSEAPDKYETLVKQALTKTGLPLVLMSQNPQIIASGLRATQSSRPLIHCATAVNWEQMLSLARENKCPLAVHGIDIEQTADIVTKIKATGFDDLVLDATAETDSKTLENLTILRRLAIRKNYRPLGYPVIVVADSQNGNGSSMLASISIMKYASAVIINDATASRMLPLLTLRQNIYTDPQKPIQVKPGLYEIGKPTPDSPLFFTTNFSLTYFTVKGDIEKSKVSSYLLVVDAEGLSVLTAYAANKLTPESVAEYIQKMDIKSKIKHNKLIIPGLVARMTIKLRELTGMEIIVGPRDSSGLPVYLKGAWCQ
jgi:acetyl-CoA decarbonylase/synthase complex subunit gamma